MNWIILLVAGGITLISLEIIIPGGILGAIGVISVLAGCVMCFTEFGSLGGLLGTAAIFALTGLILWLDFRLLARTSLGRRIFLTKSVNGVSASYGEEAKKLIGKPAEAVTTLAPSGYVTIEGRRYEAFCQSGLIKAGTALKVISTDNFRLIVAPQQTSPAP